MVLVDEDYNNMVKDQDYNNMVLVDPEIGVLVLVPGVLGCGHGVPWTCCTMTIRP